MKIDIAPNFDQIRWFAEAALHAWDVCPENARENVAADMTALLAYLDACENGSGRVVLGVRKIERGIRLEVSWRNNQTIDLTDGYPDDRDASDRSGNHQPAVALGPIDDVRPQRDGRAPETEIDFKPLPHGGKQC